MYVLNKIVGGCLNPLVIGLAAIALCGVCAFFRRRRLCMTLVVASIVWFWFWSMPITYQWIGGALEREWPIVKAEEAPKADAIVLLGGGMGANTNDCPYAEMWSAADRVWHAARLYKAGKAPIIIPTGSGERQSALPLLLDFGVPESAIIVEDQARNTEENAKFVEAILATKGAKNTKRVLLVTSAWHMRRSMLMYKKYAPSLEIIPAATDYEATTLAEPGFCFKDIWADAGTIYSNSCMFKECIGYWGYKLLRR